MDGGKWCPGRTCTDTARQIGSYTFKMLGIKFLTIDAATVSAYRFAISTF